MSEEISVPKRGGAPRDANAPLVASPDSAAWRDIKIEHYRQRPPNDVEVPPLSAHFLSVFLGEPVPVVQGRDGKSYQKRMTPGDITLMPAGLPSRWRWDGNADVLHLYLAPQRVVRIAEMEGGDGGLELANRF